MSDRFDHLEAARTLATIEIPDDAYQPLPLAARFATAHALIAIAESLRIAAKPILVVNAGGDPAAVADGIQAAIGRCTSDVTLRDEDHRLVRCCLPVGHVEPHTDKRGVSWTDGE